MFVLQFWAWLSSKREPWKTFLDKKINSPVTFNLGLALTGIRTTRLGTLVISDWKVTKPIGSEWTSQVNKQKKGLVCGKNPTKLKTFPTYTTYVNSLRECVLKSTGWKSTKIWEYERKHKIYKIVCQQMPESDEINHVYELQNAKNNNPVHAVRNDWDNKVLSSLCSLYKSSWSQGLLPGTRLF